MIYSIADEHTMIYSIADEHTNHYRHRCSYSNIWSNIFSGSHNPNVHYWL